MHMSTGSVLRILHLSHCVVSYLVVHITNCHDVVIYPSQTGWLQIINKICVSCTDDGQNFRIVLINSLLVSSHR